MLFGLARREDIDGIKDVFNTAPELGMATTLGSYAFRDAKGRENAKVIQQVMSPLILVNETVP